jgi:hypothetical protein
MGWIVLVVVVLTVFGAALAVYGRYRGTSAGIARHPGGRPDHPEEDSPQDAFEQVVDDRGSR